MKRIYTLMALTILMSTLSISWGQTAIDLAGPGNSAVINYELPNGPFTIQYDMYMHSIQNYNAGVTITCGSNPAPYDFYVDNTGGGFSYVGNCGSDESFINPLMTFTAGTWYNIAVVYPGGGQGIQIYVDGSFEGANTGFPIGAGTYSTLVDDFIRIGTRMDDATNADAKYDNLRVWSVARTQSQIMSDIGTCLTGNEPGLDILMDMEEGTGTTIFDQALGNGAQNATVNGTYSWTSGVPLGSYTSETISACESYTTPAATQTWTTSGVYYDTLTNISGCDSIITYDLTINTSMLDAGLDETQCEGSSVVLNASGASTYSWSPATGLSTTTGPTVVAGPTSTTTYTVTGTDANGCVGTDSLTFTVNQNPSVDLGGPYYQENPPLTLDAGAGFSSYSWSTTETTQSIEVSTNDTYSVTVVDSNGCSGTGAAYVAFTASLSNIDGTETFVKIYPNPASSFITLEMNDYNGAAISVALVDANGKQLREIAFNNLMKIDISNFQAGVYFLQINTGQEVKLVQFIVE